MGASGISSGFPELFRTSGQVSHVLLTRSPLTHKARRPGSFDLHVLSTPPAFVLSQDQTLHWRIDWPPFAVVDPENARGLLEQRRRVAMIRCRVAGANPHSAAPFDKEKVEVGARLISSTGYQYTLERARALAVLILRTRCVHPLFRFQGAGSPGESSTCSGAKPERNRCASFAKVDPREDRYGGRHAGLGPDDYGLASVRFRAGEQACAPTYSCR